MSSRKEKLRLLIRIQLKVKEIDKEGYLTHSNLSSYDYDPWGEEILVSPMKE
jgi:hypothetical protein